MTISVLTTRQLDQYLDDVSALHKLVFPDASIDISPNNELLTYGLVLDGSAAQKATNKVVGFGAVYTRKMQQGTRTFNAGIVGGIAIHPDYRGQGLCSRLMTQFDAAQIQANVEHSFLFAYEPRVYHAVGYQMLHAPIHFFDTPSNQWASFVYRGGMVKSFGKENGLPIEPHTLIEFNGQVY
ncbi:GNAT family N-acetyltransferase [Enterovibrio norvegicus]|uniref:GNAT family N-acetyltransferase n=1 Tax=Enterovibrio norvegicus TaxID=188144 RepID=A0ABV4L775_9GAMM|nr:GNAT family N-acetyltransferase [Enterovibrio norvegicus]OEF56414.1 GNAT family N-acetyltransferase [Enterovibrio norvegicus]